MEEKNHFIIIMAGGIGSRFWPASTKEKPKQFLDILDTGKSLIQMTYERCVKWIPKENILICTHIHYLNLVKEHLPDLPEENILCEPSLNNTAPCIAYAALKIQAKAGNAVLAVIPSDHIILDEEQFQRTLRQAFYFARQEKAIVTLGIKPLRPDTGYGYIEIQCECAGTSDEKLDDPSVGICKVKSFKEKPDQETAEKYIQSGQHLWNAGMFVWQAETILEAFRQHASDILNILLTEPGRIGSEEEKEYLSRVYPFTRKVSIDYAILEKADNVYTLPADMGWSDLGTWASLYAYVSTQNTENVVRSGRRVIEESSGNIIRIPDNKSLILRGLRNFIVVDEGNALLIYPIEKEQEIKESLKKLEN
ncbi:MAG TPA: mannose-1-phosphate guanylyltransferase [Saprospiraceae bacterium]|nr:mannose-1-phosphate guanylyltransferase [Saprospiraceae bacterium]